MRVTNIFQTVIVNHDARPSLTACKKVFIFVQFTGHGLTVIQRNYLEVYIYEKWSDKEIIDYESVSEFEPTSIDLNQGTTEPPPLLTEADLISLVRTPIAEGSEI